MIRYKTYNNLVSCLSTWSSPQRIKSQSELSERLKKKRSSINQKPSISKLFKQQKPVKLVSNQKHKPNERLVKYETRLLDLEQSNLVNNEDKLNLLELKSLDQEVRVSRDTLFQNEKEFLNKSSFKIRNSELDENGQNLLNKMQSLTKSSVDPRHLTILHSSLASKISHQVYNKIFDSPQIDQQTLQTFLELQPGFGLITDNLISQIESNTESAKNRSKFILIEQFSKFLPYLNELKSRHETRHDIKILKAAPFSNTYLYESNVSNQKNLLKSLLTDDKMITKIQPHLFGIIPWNTKDFLNRLYTSYCADSGYFGLNKSAQTLNDIEFNLEIKTPEFYFYIPEFIMAKLNPFHFKNFHSFNSKLAVFSNTLTKIEVISEEKNDYFFPYPLISSPYTLARTKIDLKKMYLVNIKFYDSNESMVKNNKRLFYLFVSQLFCRSNDYIKDSLRSMCTDPELVCKETSVYKYSKIKMLNPYKFLKLFNFIVDNKELSKLDEAFGKDNYLINEQLGLNQNTPKPIDQRKLEMKALKNINKNFSGQLVLPLDGVKESKDQNNYKINKNKKR